jgi:carnosine N-methyltransferase
MDLDESSYLLRTILSFKHYRPNTFTQNHLRVQNYYSLPASQRTLLPNFLQRLEGIDQAVEVNALLAKRIARLGEEMYLGGQEVRMGGPLVPRQRDMDKARSTLRQFVRDWSEEGKTERELCYTPVLEALNTLYKDTSIEERYTASNLANPVRMYRY